LHGLWPGELQDLQQEELVHAVHGPCGRILILDVDDKVADISRIISAQLESAARGRSWKLRADLPS
jgi:hypothetical protein